MKEQHQQSPVSEACCHATFLFNNKLATCQHFFLTHPLVNLICREVNSHSYGHLCAMETQLYIQNGFYLTP